MTTTVTLPATLVSVHPTYSIVGGAGSATFSDGSDATYVRQPQGDAAGHGPDGTYYDQVITFTTPAVDFPDNARYPGISSGVTSVGAMFSVRLKWDSGAPSRSFGSDADHWLIHLVDPSTGALNTMAYLALYPMSGTVPTDWTDYYLYTLSTFSADYFPVDLMRSPMTFSMGKSTFFDNSLVSEISLTVSWDLFSAGAPPSRQFPRDDGLATSSATRAWPPPRSVQRGIRRAGHTYP